MNLMGALWRVQVAACVCLFSLDKHAAIPVDTHVWQLATRYYTPSLKGVLSHLPHWWKQL